MVNKNPIQWQIQKVCKFIVSVDHRTDNRQDDPLLDIKVCKCQQSHQLYWDYPEETPDLLAVAGVVVVVVGVVL